MAFAASPAIRRGRTSPTGCIRSWAEREHSRKCGAAPAASRLTLPGMAASLPTSQEIIIRAAPLGSFFDRVDWFWPAPERLGSTRSGARVEFEEAEHGT